MKKFLVEVKIGIFMDEMDDDNSTESVSEIADFLVVEAINKHWSEQIATTVTRAVELSSFATEMETLDAWCNDRLGW